MQQEEEFDEEDLFGEGADEQQRDDDASSHEEEEERVMPGHSAGIHIKEPERMEGSGMSSGGLFALNAIVEDEGPDTAGHKVQFHPTAMGIPRQNVPFSMPTTSAMRMGTSAPIAMPMMPRRIKKDSSEAADPEEEEGGFKYPATFIPPHELSLRQDNFMSVAGGASLMKRDKLRARNAILKATGFVEVNAHAGVHPEAVQICSEEWRKLRERIAGP